jgi:hypothetical protein
MNNNRRSFFKGLAAFASGVVAAKVSSYTPKKEEQKETMLVSSAITLKHEGKEYHPLVVEKTTSDGDEMVSENNKSSVAIGGTDILTVQMPKPKIRKANV